MRHGSLFSGIGGFELAASWMGWTNVFCCETEAFCRNILKYYWPKSACYENIFEFRAVRFKGKIDIISGGFPCQPFSIAGKRKGTVDNRYLWPEMLRVIGEVQPRWVVAENVLGLLNWKKGLVFDQVQVDLEVAGYKVWSYVLPAAGVGAPHRRERVWFVAYANSDAKKGEKGSGTEAEAEEGHKSNNASSKNAYGADQNDHSGRAPKRSIFFKRNTAGSWQDWPSQPLFYRGNDGLPTGMDGIAFSKWKEESVSAFGNTIVPEVAYRIFAAIDQFECKL